MMTTTISKIKSYFARWRECELNPILIKELRQAVRSQVLEGIMMVLLLMLFLGSVVTLVKQSWRDSTMQAGQAMFCSCLGILAVGGLLFIPIYTSIRLGLEKNQADLMFFTPLSRRHVVHGKVLSGVYLSVMYLTVCMPFMALSSLLGGLDSLTILFTIFLLFMAIGTAILASVAIGAIRVHVIGKLVLGTTFVSGLILFCLITLLILFEVVRFGVEPLIKNGDAAFKVFTFFMTLIVGSIIFYGLSLSLIEKEPRLKNCEEKNLHSFSSYD